MAEKSSVESTDREICPKCGNETGIGLWPWCPHGQPHFHVHSGRIIWLGSQVYGKKKLLSDELRADTEADMVGG